LKENCFRKPLKRKVDLVGFWFFGFSVFLFKTRQYLKDLTWFSLEAAAYVDTYFYHSDDDTCEAALDHHVMPAVHLDIPVPAFDTCFENPGCCYVKMECLPDGRLQEIHYLDDKCSVEKNIHNTNHSSAIFENGVCNKQGEHHFLTMKWDSKYCAPTHTGNLRSIRVLKVLTKHQKLKKGKAKQNEYES